MKIIHYNQVLHTQQLKLRRSTLFVILLFIQIASNNYTSNTFGPRQSLRAVIPTIILQSIFKKKISLGKVDTRRDFTFVDDTVNGFLKLFAE